MDRTPDGRETSSYAARRLQLKIASRAIGTHHRAIWEEAKHYTWWLLAIAIALMLLGASGTTSLWVRAVIVMVGCLAGVIVALIGFKVIRREVEVLDKSFEVYDRLVKDLDLEGGALAAPGRPNKGLWKLFVGACGRKKTTMETWDWFQISFVLAAALYFVAFVGVLVYSILA